MWRPGTGSPNRNFVRVADWVWKYYQHRIKEIGLDYFTRDVRDDEYALDVEERFTADASGADYDRAQLRKQIFDWYEQKAIFVNDEAQPRLTRGPFIIPI